MLKKIGLFTTLTLIIITAGLTGVHSQQSAMVKEPKQSGGMWGPPDRNWWDEWQGSDMEKWQEQRMRRHWRFMHGEVPEKYKNLSNPLKFETENIDQGRDLYQKACAKCHGKSGMGDGTAAKNLRPSPALLAYLIQRPIAADSYLMWTISEGGVKSKTEMPAFKENLSQEDIWKIIIYMHSGFPAVKNDK